MSILDQIDKNNLPQHLAIIMDGNGRWATSKGKIRVFGHKNGKNSVKKVTDACRKLGIKFLTLYAFSTENWNRPKSEIDMLMRLLTASLNDEKRKLNKNEIRLNAIGDIERLPEKTKEKLLNVIETTKHNKELTVTLALSYGSRQEIIEAVKKIASKVKNNIILESNIDESIINEHLYTHDLPNVDLLIRTSGEHRISNFLLWQVCYAEFYFTDVLWPDFTEENLYEAIISYQKRERRFGQTSEQLQHK